MSGCDRHSQAENYPSIMKLSPQKPILNGQSRLQMVGVYEPDSSQEAAFSDGLCRGKKERAPGGRMCSP